LENTEIYPPKDVAYYTYVCQIILYGEVLHLHVTEKEGVKLTSALHTILLQNHFWIIFYAQNVVFWEIYKLHN